jgi:hypothetical protein
MRRVLAPGGRLGLAVMRRGERASEQRAAALRDRWFGMHSFGVAELESLLGAAGFAQPRVLHEHGGWMLAAAER